jgi:hypothetical protein
MNESSLEFTAGRRQTYEEERRARLRRGRFVGFSVCIALWLLSAIPLARLSSDDGGGVGVAVAYLVAGFGIALVARGIYVLLKKRTFWSPWLFVTAAVLAIMSYAVVSAGEKVDPALAAALAFV